MDVSNNRTDHLHRLCLAPFVAVAGKHSANKETTHTQQTNKARLIRPALIVNTKGQSKTNNVFTSPDDRLTCVCDRRRVCDRM